MMPLIRKPTTQELEDHFFGSGAFMWGWFSVADNASWAHFPTIVVELNEDREEISRKEITEDMFVEGIKQYAESLEDRTFDDLIEDMGARDVDAVIQLIMFGEIKYS